jgi:HTH-type transcriptional regulator/antitoxin HipB
MGKTTGTRGSGAERERVSRSSTSDNLALVAFVTDKLEHDPEFRRIWEDPQRKIGREVQLRRHQLGWSQRELARKVGTSPNQIHVIEKGEGNPTVDTLKRLGDALGKDLEIRYTDPSALVATYKAPKRQ